MKLDIGELKDSLKEFQIWRGTVDKRINSIETIQSLQKEKLEDLEGEALIAREERVQVSRRILELSSRVEKNCTSRIFELSLISFGVVSVLLIIYLIVKDVKGGS